MSYLKNIKLLCVLLETVPTRRYAHFGTRGMIDNYNGNYNTSKDTNRY